MFIDNRVGMITKPARDKQGRPLSLVLTGDEACDMAAFDPLIDIPAPPPERFIADKGYG